VKFHLSPEQEALQDSILRTAQRVCPPERRRALLDAPTDFDRPIWEAVMELGVGGLMIPEDFGGVGFGLEDTALAMEALGQTATPGPFFGHVLAGWALAQSDDAALKDRWLPRLAAGEAVATIALDGWSPEEWAPEVAGGVANGQVRFVPGADQAGLIVVGTKSGLAVVEAGKGVELEAMSGSDMTRRLWHVKLTDAPATLIGGADTARRLVDAGLILLAADALGGAEQALAMTVEYAKQREQFGQVIAKFQALKHQFANMALEVEPARALVWYAAYAWDLGLPDAPRVAAHAKAHLADRFVSVARMAVQCHGGIGYTWEYDLQIWFRRSLFDRAFLGAPSTHRERVAVMAGW
jgi:alkylation response protein AidB-like acyl-CoA dehydrogenase